jgi:hypothetical protein
VNRLLAALNPATHRRMRIVLPFAVLTALILGTLLVHALEQPDPGDAAYLNPGASDGTGSDRLAAALRARGVEVDRADSIQEAVDRVRVKPGSTLFVPAPSFVDLRELTEAGLPSGSRIVVAGAGSRDLERSGWAARHQGARWAAKAVGADCDLPLPGPAAVLRQRYASEAGTVCYGGGLLTFAEDQTTVVLVGAADPFRNDRIGEHANEEFATAVLGSDRVVWLGLHARETEEPEPVPSDATSPAPPLDPPSEDTSPRPVPSGPTAEPTVAPPAADGGQPPRPPLTDAFPSAFWATLLLAVLVLIALAAAAARRLGSPVAEPLPSRVPASETMLGHAGLYRRARARGASLGILRATARRQLTEHLGLPRDARADEIAARAGMPAEHVRAVLDGGAPEKDGDLVRAAENVQKLVRDVLHRPTSAPDLPRRPDEGETQ